jgi:glycyl-tRNA synthetase
VLAVLMDAYSEKTNDKGEMRVILKLSPQLAPIKGGDSAACEEQAGDCGYGQGDQAIVAACLRAVYDDTGGIGKLYARQDEMELRSV